MNRRKLQELFEYNPEGYLVWKNVPSQRQDLIGQRAGWQRPLPSPRRHISLGGKVYYEHRLIFCFHHGFYPRFVDHINGDPLDNRIENLRTATASQNQANQKESKKNKSGTRGVHYCKRQSKWIASLTFNRKLLFRKAFPFKHHAEFARKEAERKFFGEFTRG